MSGTGETDFDEYASDYDAALARGVSVSGEDKDYFAQGRVAWLGRRLAELGRRPGAVLDFGCGTGSAAPFLMRMPGIDSLVGVDVSARSVERARQMHAATGARFLLTSEHRPEGTIDLAFCNGVFHHIPPPARASAVDYIARAVRPGGFFAFWENNPWNPGARYVMSRIPFDRDAIMIAAPEARRLLRAAGFDVVRTDFQFLFPRVLKVFRGLEPLAAGLPLGAQYQVLGRRR
ncbi:MAG TPA: class I SAM-dependent methyltransferase [Vicinamibacterales bacterium]|jgi:SAM-dependent methyltransferase|nr:class I SAM-dependent methyltransferase [Vicinamibacterales bacterium]